MGRADEIYRRLPAWAQHVAVSTYGLTWYWHRFGPGYPRYVQEYASRDRWTADVWRAWQQERVRELLPAAAAHVPYYQRVWKRNEQVAARAGRLEDLPLLEKETVRAAPMDFIRQDLRTRPHLMFPTSGTTGTPLRTFWTSEETRRSMAVREARSLGWAGTSYRLPRATFGSRMPVTDLNSKGPYYRFNLVERQIYFSGYHLRPDNVADYVRALHQHNTRWITGYTGACYFMAKLILEQQLTVPPLKAMVVTSENMTPEMRQVIEEAFACRVFEEYAAVEHIALATDCEYGRLHVNPDVGLLEILRPDGTSCEPGEVGEVVGTSLLHTSQPLVRYRQGDLAAWDSRPCPCGRAMPVIREILGRLEDVVIAPDGRRLFRFTLVFGNQPNIREGQIIQEALDRFRVRVVPAPSYGPADTDDLIRRVRRQVGADVTVIVETVERVPRTAAGKIQMVVSRLKSRDTHESVPVLPSRCPVESCVNRLPEAQSFAAKKGALEDAREAGR